MNPIPTSLEQKQHKNSEDMWKLTKTLLNTLLTSKNLLKSYSIFSFKNIVYWPFG